MNQESFREKSIKKFSSPESMDEYLKRAGVGTGLIAGAAALLAAVGIMWGMMENIEGNILQKGVNENEHVTAEEK